MSNAQVELIEKSIEPITDNLNRVTPQKKSLFEIESDIHDTIFNSLVGR